MTELVSAPKRTGRGGRTATPGAFARSTGPVMLGVGVALALLAGLLWWNERELRDLDALVRAEAQVVGVDGGGRGPDFLELSFTPRGQDVEAGVPSSLDLRTGDRVQVAYVPDDPSRVRTVEGWEPTYTFWGSYAAMFGVGGTLLTVFGWVSRRRGGAFEDGAAAPVLKEDAVGRRVVRGSRWAPRAMLGVGVLLSALLAGKGVADPSDVEAWYAAAFCLVFFAGLVFVVHRYGGGSDGVWVTDSELIARRRSTVRRWPWAQVRELGTVTQGGQPVAVAARVDDGEEDGIGGDGWITLARPAAGPFVGHRNHSRLEQVARERGLPYTDGLMDDDLADTVHGLLRYRLSARRRR